MPSNNLAICLVESNLSKLTLMIAVRGAASKTPIIPHIMPQKIKDKIIVIGCNPKASPKIFGSTILPIPIAILQYPDLPSVLLIIFLPAIIHQIIGNIVEPKIFGDAFGLHPITIILSLIFWGMIWGIIGVLLAAPLTAIIRVSFERFDSTRQIARLLEGKVHLQD